MFLSRTPRAAAAVLGFAFLGVSLLGGCGSRSTLGSGDAEPNDDHVEPPECTTDDDCASLCAPKTCSDGVCVTAPGPVPTCDDGDPCTTDACDDAVGCSHDFVTPDADGDGYRAALPGYLPGEPGACGDDCDDTSGRAHPGGFERCDGTDNDCDGIIDNGELYLAPRFPEPIRLSSFEATNSGAAGIAYGGDTFAVSYGAEIGTYQSYVRGLSSVGQETFEEQLVSDVNVLSFGAVLEWSGNAFGAAWSDPRQDGNYEVYFSRFDALGNKLGPDLRVTEAPDFSIHTNMIYDQGRFLLVWDDRRTSEASSTDEAIIFGQIIDSEGNAVDKNLMLSLPGLVSEYPQIAANDRRLAVSFSVLDPHGGGVMAGYRTFDKQFGNPSDGVMNIGGGSADPPHVTGLRDKFVLTWSTSTIDGPGESIMAAIVDDYGNLLVGPVPVTSGGKFARTHTTVSLGDRFVLIWADYLTGNYELYGEVLGSNLEVIEPRTQLTFDPLETVGPTASLSEDGSLGIVFDTFGDGHQSYFTAIGCPVPVRGLD
jgi:hypothetical protein